MKLGKTYEIGIHEPCYLVFSHVRRKALETGHEICLSWLVPQHTLEYLYVMFRHRVLDLGNVSFRFALWPITFHVLEVRASKN
jgi:hypothetical protein